MWSYSFLNNFLKAKIRFYVFLPWSLILLLSLYVQGAQAEMAEELISCKISLVSPQNLTEGVFVTFSVYNQSNENLSLLSWYTPFEGFLSNLFIILDSNGVQLNYQGPMVKRATPLASNFIELLAKKKATVTLDLTQAYPLSKGSFSVQLLRTQLQLKDKSANLRNITCSVELALLQIN